MSVKYKVYEYKTEVKSIKYKSWEVKSISGGEDKTKQGISQEASRCHHRAAKTFQPIRKILRFNATINVFSVKRVLFFLFFLLTKLTI